jgi:acyl-coenzyme A thioesterase PaaI-like protein
MRVLNLSFTERNGIRLSESAAYLLQLDAGENVSNHLGTIHGSALFALAEISSGYLLQTNFADIADQTIPILRASTVKYRKMGTGTIYSSAAFDHTDVDGITAELLSKLKVLLTISVRLYNQQDELVLTGDFEWFITLRQPLDSHS